MTKESSQVNNQVKVILMLGMLYLTDMFQLVFDYANFSFLKRQF